MQWILIISALSSMSMTGATMSGKGSGYQVSMQEFNTVEACQFASMEAQKIAPTIKVVCVPKGAKVQ